MRGHESGETAAGLGVRDLQVPREHGVDVALFAQLLGRGDAQFLLTDTLHQRVGGAATAHYDLVSTATTGHAESVEVTFDPARVSYAELLRVFFTVAHDPTERDRQGPDVGSQYRSVVFYGTPEQHAAAVAMIAALERETAYPRPIVTEVVALERFYPAEAYHQDYLAHHRTSPYIVYNDLPKLKQLEARFPKLYRP